jgi:hypothetical protein
LIIHPTEMLLLLRSFPGAVTRDGKLAARNDKGEAFLAESFALGFGQK